VLHRYWLMGSPILLEPLLSRFTVHCHKVTIPGRARRRQ
jgi:hypothetical protein